MLQERFKTYQGVKRRFSEKNVGKQVLIDDYAHHPTEINATISAARQKYPNREVVAVFQPHTFTRTQTFLEDFAASLQHADKVYLCDILDQLVSIKVSYQLKIYEAKSAELN